MDYLIDSLRKVPMLAPLRQEYLEMLAKLANVRTYKKSEIIIKQGDPGTGLFIIITGSVTITSKSRPGMPDAILANMGKGDFFGDMSLIDGYPRSATVAATSECQVLELNRWVFLDALRREPNIAVAMLPVLVKRIRLLEEAKPSR
jgi:CRP-like cAMP-binding protein